MEYGKSLNRCNIFVYRIKKTMFGGIGDSGTFFYYFRYITLLVTGFCINEFLDQHYFLLSISFSLPYLLSFSLCGFNQTFTVLSLTHRRQKLGITKLQGYVITNKGDMRDINYWITALTLWHCFSMIPIG
jgi:hypothetical protein